MKIIKENTPVDPFIFSRCSSAKIRAECEVRGRSKEDNAHLHVEERLLYLWER
jgi:hypothetical protein